MNRMTRLVVATGAGLALALTASPALAAPPSAPGSNPAQVEHTEFSSPDGSYTREFRAATRYVDNEHYTTNTRDKETWQIDGSQSSFDYQTHYSFTDNVTKMTSQNTFTEYGVTCRTNSQSVTVNGETRTQKSHSSC